MMKQLFQNIIKILCVAVMLVFVFKSFFFQHTVTYTNVDERELIALSSQAIINEINTKKDSLGTTLSIEQMMDISQELTNKQLKFSSGKVPNNPNNAAQIGKANCVGYAALYASIMDFLIRQQNEADKYEVKHLVGTLDFMGNNLNQAINHPFFKDHDYNEITILATGKKIYTDPSVSDVLGIHRIQVKE